MSYVPDTGLRRGSGRLPAVASRIAALLVFALSFGFAAAVVLGLVA